MKNTIIIVIIILAIFLLFTMTSNENNSSSQSEQRSTTIEEGTYESQSLEEDESNDSLNFGGYDCTDDCSGHEAGYEWAEEHDITQDDVDNYSGNSDSFREGMQSYIDENE